MEYLEGIMSMIQGPIIATAFVIGNVMIWMILVIIGAFLDMKNEEMRAVTPIY